MPLPVGDPAWIVVQQKYIRVPFQRRMVDAPELSTEACTVANQSLLNLYPIFTEGLKPRVIL